MVDLIIEEGVSAALVNGVAGVEYSEIFAKLKGAGVKILYRPSTFTVEEARLGADVYIATGFDEGGTVPGNRGASARIHYVSHCRCP